MAAPLSPAQREEYGYRAWKMSLRGKKALEIGRELGISERAVDRLLAREREKVAKLKEPERTVLLARFEGEQDEVIEDAWERLEMIDATERVAPDFQANILAASVNKAKAHGLFVDRVEHSGSLELLTQLLNTPQTITIAEPAETAEFDA